ncbi:hypothetical protein [Parasitella parasitica]|uniref:Uncharacterized protein n=1 Tax=Parasitella parasitica TaxID=35722 RepID=A0A0B7NLF6_9FUNG|nr:hypothetical protein [Parasitella parasitica]
MPPGKRPQADMSRSQFRFHDVMPMSRQTLVLFKDPFEDLWAEPEQEYYRDNKQVDISRQLIILGQVVDYIFNQMTTLKDLTIPLFPSQPPAKKQPLSLNRSSLTTAKSTKRPICRFRSESSISSSLS